MEVNVSIVNGGFFKTKKTLITAVVSIISFVAAYFVGDVNLVELLQVAIPLLGVVFMGNEISISLQTKIDELNSKKK
jgi:hypothetical protein